MADSCGIIVVRRINVQTTKNLHVPLPDPMYKRLRREAIRSRRPATSLAREAIDQWLHEQEKKLEFDAVAEYARAMAGTPFDLDEELERAAVEELLALDEDEMTVQSS